MYSPLKRHSQCFLFRRHKSCLLNNDTNTIKITQSTLSPTECRIFSAFNPFHTFHPSQHESIAEEKRGVTVGRKYLLNDSSIGVFMDYIGDNKSNSYLQKL